MAGGIISNLMYAIGFKFKSKGISDADKKVSKLTKGVVGLGLAAGSAMVGIAAAGIHAADEFEKAMNKVQGTTGATADQMEATKEIAKSLYSNNMGEDWQDLGSAIANVQQVTGQTGDALEQTTRDALLLRDAFGFEVNESIKSVDTMMKQFGITSEEAMNLIADGAQKGLDKSGELMDSANEYANQFKSLGFDASEMFDVFAAGSAEGVFQLDKVGDAVKEFNIRSKDGSKTSSDAFKMLGLDADKMMSTFAAGGPKARQAFSDVVSMISDVEDPVARNTIGVALMGSQFEDLEINVISAMGTTTRSFDKSKAKMDELAKIKFERPGEALKMFGRTINAYVLVPIGQKMLPYLNRFGQWLVDHKPQIEAVGKVIADKLGGALGAVAGWVKAALPYLQQFGTAVVDKVGSWIQTATPYLQEFGQKVGDAFNTLLTKGKELWNGLQPIVELIGTKLLDAAVALWPEVQNIATQIYDVGKAIMQWEPFIPIVSGIAAIILTYKTTMFAVATATKIAGFATKVWSGITKAFIAVQTAFNAVMAMNPIALIALAIVGLTVALVVAYKRSEKFRNFIDRMWAGIKKATSVTLNFFKVKIPEIFNNVLNFIKKWGPKILMVITGPIGLLVGLIIKNWDTIKSVTITVFTGIWNWLKSIWNSISTAVSKAASGIWRAVTKAWENIKNAIGTAMGLIKDTISNSWEDVVTALSGLGERIGAKFTGIWGAVKKTFADALNWIIDKFNKMIDKMNSLSIKNPLNGDDIGVNIPRIPTVDGSNKNGLDFVPFDGYISELHKGERVLTAQENKAYTPESSPARSARNSSHEISLKVDFSGAAGASNMSGADEKRMRQMLQDELQKALRIMNLEAI